MKTICYIGIILRLLYYDDMVLLSPSISALRKPVKISESYAGSHGLKYSAEKRAGFYSTKYENSETPCDDGVCN